MISRVFISFCSGTTLPSWGKFASESVRVMSCGPNDSATAGLSAAIKDTISRCHRAPEATRLFCKPCRELPFDFLVRHGFPAFNLIQPLADGGKKFQPFGDGVQTRIIRQALDGFQRKLLIAHAPTLHERGAKCNGRYRSIP